MSGLCFVTPFANLPVPSLLPYFSVGQTGAEAADLPGAVGLGRARRSAVTPCAGPDLLRISQPSSAFWAQLIEFLFSVKGCR